VHRRMRTLSDRIFTLLTERNIVPTDTDPRGVLLAVELADRAMELAYRGRDDFDDEMLAAGRSAVNAYVESLQLARA
jgi:hypothetical protein